MDSVLDWGLELLPENGTDLSYVASDVTSVPGSEGTPRGWEYGADDIAPESNEYGDRKVDVILKSLFLWEDVSKTEKGEKQAEKVMEETALEKAGIVAEGERKKTFQKRKRAREEELSKFLEQNGDQEVDSAYARRLICNRDSAAGKRRKDAVYREQLRLALRDLEAELEQLQKQRKEMRNEYEGVMGNAEIYSGPSVA
eukprot:CAMPEP_0184742062 /NCGR_PEP_ID=MMETSP0315-20130426/5081_1 /TAXON_ID=101924 /ORGANISM="Rhodosorus marinus, Strain UTEX LB 2760" /LENGTH=198 /DNA_ID=CAMNT_0027212739 /DNA_START=164 /DNA_END=760 /DNA_ORIENTATION=-